LLIIDIHLSKNDATGFSSIVDDFLSRDDKNVTSGQQFLRDRRLVVASHNAGKVGEIKDLLAPLGVDVVAAVDLRIPEPEETEATFAGNARLKAEAAAKACGLAALADDSGLEVAALDGAPGVQSARWAGPNRDFAAAMRKVEAELKERRAADFSARFVCALALAFPDAPTQVFEGEAKGRLVFPPRGDKGFGYDPIFIPEGDTRTFGEMPPEEKHLISHRADAFRKLTKAWF
jgi:XTP/dITP diphosphohydrolase